MSVLFGCFFLCEEQVEIRQKMAFSIYSFRGVNVVIRRGDDSRHHKTFQEQVQNSQIDGKK